MCGCKRGERPSSKQATTRVCVASERRTIDDRTHSHREIKREREREIEENDAIAEESNRSSDRGVSEATLGVESVEERKRREKGGGRKKCCLSDFLSLAIAIARNFVYIFLPNRKVLNHPRCV